MIKSLDLNFKGLVTVSGPTKSGKSKLAEYLIKDQFLVNYIATSQPRQNDQNWQKRIDVHKKRRPASWKIFECPKDICDTILSFSDDESILIDSLGGLVENLINTNDNDWNFFQNKFLDSLLNKTIPIVIVTEEVGWGIVPYTSIGNLFRERLSSLSSLVSHHSKNNWLAINGIAIDLKSFGSPIP